MIQLNEEKIYIWLCTRHMRLDVEPHKLVLFTCSTQVRTNSKVSKMYTSAFMTNHMSLSRISA